MSNTSMVPTTEVQNTWKRRQSHIHLFIYPAIPSFSRPGVTDLYLLVMAARDLGKPSYNPEYKSYEKKKQGRKSEVRGCPVNADCGNSYSYKVTRAQWFF